jgi:hypothetical protein
MPSKKVIGELTLIKKMWVKFDEMDVVCVCDEYYRKCKDNSCKEYVVKFTEVRRDPIEEIADMSKSLTKEIKKLDSELKKSINKFKL